MLVNAQDFQKTFELLDNTLTTVFPKATVKMAPLIATNEAEWRTCDLSQNAFHEINALVRERDHVEFDSYLPSNMNWICADKVHFKDFDGVKFWRMIFEQLDA